MIMFEFNIKEFWKWFVSISSNLLADPTNDILIAQIDSHVSDLGPFDWEIGPWPEGSFYFSISPNLDFAKLELTKRIIEFAPFCAGWHFLPSKPPKVDWQGIWKMTNESGKEIWIDCNEWQYRLYEFDDRTFDMDIAISDIDCNLDKKYIAIDIALTGYLGEERFMRLIKNIQIVDGFQEKATSLKYVRNHIQKIRATWLE